MSDTHDRQPAAASHGSPVSPSERLEVLDVVRGVALLGILAANLLVFAGVVYLDEASRSAMPLARVNAGVRWLQVIFIEGKFYGLFSLLFGIGAGMQLGPARDAERDRRFWRRMLGLAAIGAAHSVLWTGDILLFYAVLGLMLPSAAQMSSSRMLRVAVALFVGAALWQYLVFGGVTLLGLPSGWPFVRAWDYFEPHFAAMDAAQGRGDLWLLMRYNLTAIWADRWPGLLATGRPFKVFGFFLIGIWTVRSGIPGAIGQHGAWLRRVVRWGLPLGLCSSGLYAVGRFRDLTAPLEAVTPLAESVGILALTLSYAAMLALAWDTWQPAVLRLFQPLGRMALTVYLSQTLICLIGLSGLGVGWFMQIGAAAATLLALPVIALQMVLAHWWLARFRFGPAEWLWRSLTYRERQPMRRT